MPPWVSPSSEVKAFAVVNWSVHHRCGHQIVNRFCNVVEVVSALYVTSEVMRGRGGSGVYGGQWFLILRPPISQLKSSKSLFESPVVQTVTIADGIIDCRLCLIGNEFGQEFFLFKITKSHFHLSKKSFLSPRNLELHSKTATPFSRKLK